ncbi:hypothetical protein L218DRAFT_741139 [Marasmius fiardii PR-910]|nr:hypothetical protein L218DRAFT_741139 [Marasmius fiardii PR-910]
MLLGNHRTAFQVTSQLILLCAQVQYVSRLMRIKTKERSIARRLIQTIGTIIADLHDLHENWARSVADCYYPSNVPGHTNLRSLPSCKIVVEGGCKGIEMISLTWSKGDGVEEGRTETNWVPSEERYSSRSTRRGRTNPPGSPFHVRTRMPFLAASLSLWLLR